MVAWRAVALKVNGPRVIFTGITPTIPKTSRAFIGMQKSRVHIRPFCIRRCLALVMAVAMACTRSYPMGRLSVKALDANGAPVAAVAADLFKVTPSGQVYWRASRTGSDGLAAFGGSGGVIEGRYVIRVTLMPWQKLAPGESNDRDLTLKAGDDTVVIFRVVPRLPVRPSRRSPP